jgi:hypothetical protein
VAGFDVTEIEVHPRLTPLNTDLVDWLELFVRPTMLKGLNDEDARAVMVQAQEMLERDFKDSDGNWAIMYTRLRFAAVKPRS